MAASASCDPLTIQPTEPVHPQRVIELLAPLVVIPPCGFGSAGPARPCRVERSPFPSVSQVPTSSDPTAPKRWRASAVEVQWVEVQRSMHWSPSKSSIDSPRRITCWSLVVRHGAFDRVEPSLLVGGVVVHGRWPTIRRTGAFQVRSISRTSANPAEVTASTASAGVQGCPPERIVRRSARS